MEQQHPKHHSFLHQEYDTALRQIVCALLSNPNFAAFDLASRRNDLVIAAVDIYNRISKESKNGPQAT
jgi:hypothetical protein